MAFRRSIKPVNPFPYSDQVIGRDRRSTPYNLANKGAEVQEPVTTAPRASEILVPAGGTGNDPITPAGTLLPGKMGRLSRRMLY